MKLFWQKKQRSVFQSPVLAHLLAFLEILLGGGAAARIAGAPALDLFYYRNASGGWGWNWMVGGAVLVLLAVLWRKLGSVEFSRAALPNWGFLPGFYPALGSLMLLVSVWCWSVFRLGERIRVSGFRRISPVTAAGLTAVITLIFGGWCFFLQWKAWSSLFLLFMDWGVYLEAYWLDFSRPTAWLVTEGHWNPLPNLFAFPLIRMFPSPLTLFAIQASVLASGVPLTYLLGREYRLNREIALVAAGIYALYPAIGNLANSLFYGYHPIVWQIPVLLSFFLFQRRGNRLLTGLFFLLSLCVQETAAIFWFGYGLLLGIRWLWNFFRSRKTGGAVPPWRELGRAFLLLMGATAIFFVISQWLMPALNQQRGYSQAFHFQKFGSSFSELLLAPVQKPELFFAQLFAVENWRFLALALLPVLPGLPLAAEFLWIVFPLSAGAWLKGSPETVSIHCWYHLELYIIAVVILVVGLSRIHASRRRIGAALAALFSGLVCCWLFGAFPGGKNAQNALFQRRDYRPMIAAFRDRIPAGSTVRLTPRLRSHFVFSHRSANFNDPGAADSDFVLLDWNDSSAPSSELRACRREMGRRYSPVHFIRMGAAYCVLFHKEEWKPLPFLRSMTEEEYRRVGSPVTLNVPELSARIGIFPHKLVLFFRRNGKCERDFRLKLRLIFSDGREDIRTQYFGYGAMPAFLLAPDEVFCWEVPVEKTALLQRASLTLEDD